MTSVEVATGTEGQVVVVKRAGEGPDAERLAHEAEVLDAVRGPGAVELLGFEADDAGAELRTAWAGHHTLATVGPLPTTATARLVAEVADTVARVHELRIAHNRLTAEHIVLGAGERPVLCGFGRATRGDALAMDADVVALGDLLTSLLGPDEPVTFGPDRRSRRLDRPRNERRCSRSRIAPRPTRSAGDRARPPSPRRSVTSSWSLPQPDGARGSSTRWSLPRWTPVVAGVVGAALVLAVIALDGGEDRPTGPQGSGPNRTSPIGVVDPPPEKAAGSPASSTAPTPVPEATVPEVPPPTCPTISPPAADVDGDGCPEAYTVDGPLITLAGRTYEVGASGDLAAIADWDCDGRATPAVVRPTTGEVFVFRSWAEPAAAVTVSPTTVVGGATGVRAGDDALCPDLLVTRGDGTAVAVAADP